MTCKDFRNIFEFFFDSILKIDISLHNFYILIFKFLILNLYILLYWINLNLNRTQSLFKILLITLYLSLYLIKLIWKHSSNFLFLKISVILFTLEFLTRFASSCILRLFGPFLLRRLIFFYCFIYFIYLIRHFHYGLHKH